MNEERQIFEIIQKIFSFPKFLKHFDASKILYIDINASGNEFGVIIYYIKDWDHINNTPIPREKIEPILFLLKTINIDKFNLYLIRIS
jgi:hypothetical protein